MSIYRLHDGREVHYYTDSELSLLKKADSALSILNRRKAGRMSTWTELAKAEASTRWTAITEGIKNSRRLHSVFAQGASWQRREILSNDAVERAAQTITPHLYWKYDEWGEADDEDRVLAREIARGALAAALKETT